MNQIRKNELASDDDGNTYLFVYGTLRSEFGHPAHTYLKRTVYMGLGQTPGFLYDLGPYPALLTDPKESSFVTGEVYRLDKPEKLLPTIDQYEGYVAANPGESEYTRSIHDVTLKDGETKSLRCWVYVYNSKPVDAKIISSGDYTEVLHEPHEQQ